MPTVEGRSDDDSVFVVPSNGHRVSGTNLLPDHTVRNNGTSAATTMTNTTTQSGTTNTTTDTSVTNAGTMIRNRPSTTVTPASMSAVRRTTDDDNDNDNNDVERSVRATSVEDMNYINIHKRGAVHRRNPNHNNMNTSSPNSIQNSRHNENDDDDDDAVDNENHNTTRYPVREIQFYIRGLQDPIVINPMVSLYAIVVLWSVVIWTIGT